MEHPFHESCVVKRYYRSLLRKRDVLHGVNEKSILQNRMDHVNVGICVFVSVGIFFPPVAIMLFIFYEAM